MYRLKKCSIQKVEEELNHYRLNKLDRPKGRAEAIKLGVLQCIQGVITSVLLPLQYALNWSWSIGLMNSKMINKEQSGWELGSPVTNTEHHYSSESSKNQTVVELKSIQKCEDIEGESEIKLKSYNTIDWVIIVLKFGLWLLMWKIFILLEFGAIFFICSGFAFVWFSMYSGRKRQGFSAYSVFNPNCEQIEGTYSAEKFEKELLHR